MLFTLMTLSAQAQWFNFSENNNRAVVGINTGLVGYRNVSDLGSAETQSIYHKYTVEWSRNDFNSI